MRNYLTEFIGTFMFVLSIGLAVLSGTDMAPLAIGSALMVMVYAGGHISGAHYNPAVSLAVLLRGKMEAKDFGVYVVAQVVGAFAASAVVYLMVGKTFGPAPAANATTVGALLSEFLFTFALALVVLNSATSPKTEGNSFYGLAIGFTVTVGAFAGGPISGGAFNPAVGTGPLLMQAIGGEGVSIGHIWLYWVGPMAGGALAALVYTFQHSDSASESS